MRMRSNLLPGSFPFLQRISLLSDITTGRSLKRFMPTEVYSTENARNEYIANREEEGSTESVFAKNLADLMEESLAHSSHKVRRDNNANNNDNGKSKLAECLASLVQESYDVSKQKPITRTRVEIKRFLENRIKKKVKEQYRDGKYRNLMAQVIADSNTLKDAYDCIRVAANVDLASSVKHLSFESIAEDLRNGNFDFGANKYSIKAKGSKKADKEVLDLPKLNLRVVLEAMRIALEVVYRPHFSKISHGLRSGRSHSSALKYICKEIHDPSWWFTLVINQKLDESILNQLLSLMKEKIDDNDLFDTVRTTFAVGVLNLEFGGFPKGQGLPQEGVLSPILMNVYLDLFDREVYRLSMKYENFIIKVVDESKRESLSKLRGWFRRQINGVSEEKQGNDVRIHCCRFMDEIFFAISGPKEVALAFKSEIESYVRNSLFLNVDDTADISPCNDDRGGLQFLGTSIQRRVKENAAVRTSHKLKEKVKMFVEQKQNAWNEGAFRIGKKWLGHGLKRVKESEIKHLVDESSVLHQISRYRKPGMETDHWYKLLLKIWIHQSVVNPKAVESEETILIRNIVEPSLPRELRDSYYEFLRRAKEYVSSETASTMALLQSSTTSSDRVFTTEITAPTKFMMNCLHRYGLTNKEGYARTCHMLILLDDDLIVDWFYGLVNRWLRWHRGCENFSQVKKMISYQVRMSCVRTLAAKYRIHEDVIAKKFSQELSRIPSTEEFEFDLSQESNHGYDSIYGLEYSGLCLVSLVRKASESRPCYCFVVGCDSSAKCVYGIHVMEGRKFPGWKSGFPGTVHSSLHRRRIGLCKKHLKDLFLGDISLQSLEFCAWR